MPEQNVSDNIFQRDSIKSILNHCQYDTFVVFDLDNTLVESTQDLGSDQWFVRLMEEAYRLSPSKETIEFVIAIYYAVQHQASLQVVETQTINLLTLLQDLNIPVLVLTARGGEICKSTIDQLKRIGINFDKQWNNMECVLTLDEGKTTTLFSNGIVFCNGADKGKCLLSFFQYIKIQPKHVLMVDDKEKHLKSVKQVIEAYQGRFTGIRYGFLDEKIKTVDMKSANEQMKKMLHKFSPDVKHALVKIGLSDHSSTLDSYERLISETPQDQNVMTPPVLPFFKEKHRLVRTMSCPELRKPKYTIS